MRSSKVLITQAGSLLAGSESDNYKQVMRITKSKDNLAFKLLLVNINTS